MTCAFRMRQEHRNNIPASVHVDGTGRAQFVEEKDNPMYFRYLKELKKLTGYGVSINTSFNKHGRTIVETPKDAIQDFLDTNMDFVMIEGYLVTRK
jgi:carbamoyltransferase